MTSFMKDETVTVYCWDLSTNIYTGTKEYKAERGFGLPTGMTLDKAISESGKIAIRDTDNNQWLLVDDDRGRVFYDKHSGEVFVTTVLGEVINRRKYTKIKPPEIDEDQLLVFEDSQQVWLVGYDWYELPVWDSAQNKSFYTGDFFIAGSTITNIEPTKEQVGYILDELGQWIEPVLEEEDEDDIEETDE